MYYLVFRPQRRSVGENSFRFDYRNQTFVGFTENFEEAIRLASENQENNYQVYESDSTNLDFRRSECTRYGFRRHYGMFVLYRRTHDGQETLIKNPLESSEQEQQRLDQIKQRRLEGVQRRINELQEVQQKIQGSESS